MPNEPPSPPTPATESTHPADSAIDSDGEGIYCPLCNYNLTGAMAGRCPECGAFFDRSALIAAQRTNRVTLIPWDSPEPMSFRERLVSTLRICLFKRDRFAFAFSVQPQKTRAGGFMALVILTTILTSALAVLINTSLDAWNTLFDEDTAHFTILSLSIFFVVVSVGATLCAGSLLWVSCPHYDGRRHLKPWLSVCAYASSHYLMLLLMLPLSLLAPWVDLMTLTLAGFFTCVACSMLCCLTLIAVVKHRTAEHRRGPLVGILLAVIYVIGTALAIFISAPQADLLIRLTGGY